MLPTLRTGEYVVVNKAVYGIIKPFTSSHFLQYNTPKINDLVVFLHDNKMVVKRCVADNKSKLEYFYNTDYTLTISYPEQKLPSRTLTLTKTQYERLAPYSIIPESYVLVLGDNLPSSKDSRDYGLVNSKNIIGKVIGKK